MQPIYEVTWLDAWHDTGYYGAHKDNTPITCVDIGYLMEENEDGVMLASSFTEDSTQYRHMSFFPWEMIISMEELT